MSSPSVIIVGAGPVGLTTALALHQGGVPASDILVVDQRPSRDLSTTWFKAISASASSLEVFRLLGVAEPFMEAGLPLHRQHFGAGSKFLDLSYDVLGTKYPFNLMIPQFRTEAILLQRCEDAGIAFAWGLQFVGLEQTGEEVSATFRRGEDETETIRAPWLVGCDGTRSAVRQAAGIGFEGTRAARYGWLADGHADESAPTMVNVLSADVETGRAMIIATGDGKTGRRYFGTFPPSEITAGQRPEPPDLDFLRDWAVRNFGSHYNFRDITWASVVGDGMRIASNYRSGRVFVAGDAAHQLFPAGGQGMNTGLVDATNLAWKLALVVTGRIGPDRGVVQRVLDSYSEERLPASKAVKHNVQIQQVSMFANTEGDRAVADFMAEAFEETATNQRWARRVCGFADPVEPYQISSGRSGRVEELVGSRLTHISDSNSEDLLDAAKQNKFVVGLMAGSVFAEEQRHSLHEAVQSGGYFYKVRILRKLLKPTSQKWKGVSAVLIRPDFRVAWIAREDSSVSNNQDSFTRVLEWWFGG
ncbi:hypothetical protein VPNG_07521 [Cytospora leucostoma]|uniref:FAD-binding domain-containing protein n=1 Tax=Cytospora leucostoma TaxID=1230097 RepID=A0A423WST9_9PEZI|nr:hypothetical protein VPNG_07521 [Cytospora leucostoma]